jgi:hypothetical protein
MDNDIIKSLKRKEGEDSKKIGPYIQNDKKPSLGKKTADKDPDHPKNK